MYQILDNLPDEYELTVTPVQLWLIITLEVVLEDDFGHHLLLQYPSYHWTISPAEVDLDEGYWTPPFLGFPVPLTFVSPDRVGTVKTLFDDFEAQLDITDEVQVLAYLMGLRSPDIERGGSFIEIKRSPRNPDLTKCYKIVRFRLVSEGSGSVRNLADPECRKGYVFLPLDRLDSVLTERYSDKHMRKELLYLSKPVASNVERIVRHPETLAQLRSNRIKVSGTHFVRAEDGFVVAADLAGYGRAITYVSKNMHSLDEDGSSIATTFRERVAALLTDVFIAAGIAHVHVAGDGFIAALPTRLAAVHDVSPLERFWHAYAELLAKVDAFNNAIRDPKAQLGSRLAVHFGDFQYGRVGQAATFFPGFEGASIVEAARLEGALKEWVLERTRDDDGVFNRGSHWMTISESAAAEMARLGAAMPSWAVQVGELRLLIKEYQAAGQVYRLAEYPEPIS